MTLHGDENVPFNDVFQHEMKRLQKDANTLNKKMRLVSRERAMELMQKYKAVLQRLEELKWALATASPTTLSDSSSLLP